MAQNKVSRLADQTIKIEFSLPWQTVKQEYESTLEAAAKEVEIKGFRKGRAPKKLIEEKVGRESIYKKIIETLLPQAYAEAIREQNLKPIVNPQIKTISVKENEDWQFEAETCEIPQVELGQYQEAISKINTQDKIWTPKKSKEAVGEEKKDSQAPTNQRLSQIFAALLKEVKISLPGILTKSETDRLLANLLDEIKKLGLTLDRYLSSRNLTPQQLKEEYEKMATDNLKLEFILAKIADDLKIQVESSEIEKLLKTAKTEKEKNQLESQKYYLASVLRRRKTIDRLLKI